MSFTSDLVLQNDEVHKSCATYVASTSNPGVFIGFDNTTDTNFEGLFYNTSRPVTNLTTENYIGISDGAYADGATATIQTVGSTDDAQSGLTPGKTYYVQGDGSLATTADNPSVVAGTSLSATKIIIKG